MLRYSTTCKLYTKIMEWIWDNMQLYNGNKKSVSIVIIILVYPIKKYSKLEIVLDE